MDNTGTGLERVYVKRSGAVKAAMRRVQATLCTAGLIVPMSEIASTAIEHFEPQVALELFKGRGRRQRA